MAETIDAIAELATRFGCCPAEVAAILRLYRPGMDATGLADAMVADGWKVGVGEILAYLSIFERLLI